jgi:hypothetical protein
MNPIIDTNESISVISPARSESASVGTGQIGLGGMFRPQHVGTRKTADKAEGKTSAQSKESGAKGPGEYRR